MALDFAHPLDFLHPLEDAKAMREWLVKARRTLHAIPEPGDEERLTQDAVCAFLDGMGISYARRRTSIVALIQGAHPGPVVAIRADMDALPVQEDKARPYCSRRDGYMHACGHDAHMTCALGAAKYFSERRHLLSGSVKFLFQPAEETDGGAEKMIADGALENPRVDYVIGLHVMPDVPVGMVELKHGALNASSDYLEVAVRGEGAHAAYPDRGIDAIMIAGKVLDGLHSIVSRNVSPLSEAVITIGTIRGGTRNNIVADEVRMTGTIRTTDPAVRALLAGRVRAVVEHVCAAFGGSGETLVRPGYRALVNHDAVVDRIAAVADRIVGSRNVQWRKAPSMGVEDFSYFVAERPGAFYHLGCGNAARGIDAPLHSDRFDIDEDCLPIGVAMNAAIALDLLKGETA